jgi:hypothetical protein
MHYLCRVIATCPSIRNFRPCTLLATSYAPFKVRTAVLLKIEVFREVDAIGRPRIFDTDTHHASSFGIWLRTRTYGGGPLWVQLCFILVDEIWLRFFLVHWAAFGFSRRYLGRRTVVWLLKKVSWSSNSCLASQEGILVVEQLFGFSRRNLGRWTVVWLLKKESWSSNSCLASQEGILVVEQLFGFSRRNLGRW